MDFKISSGSGQRGRCPVCNNKYKTMFSKGVTIFMCSCGWKQEYKKYPKNIINPKNINKQ